MCRRQQQQRRFVGGVISRPLSYPDNPFEDPRDPPSPGYPDMHHASSSPPRASFLNRNLRQPQQNPFADEANALPVPSRPSADGGIFVDEPMVALAMTGIGARGRNSRLREEVAHSSQTDVPFEQQPATVNESPEESRSRSNSTAQSSPSMYPSSLPSVPSDDQMQPATPSSETATNEPSQIFAPQPMAPSPVVAAGFPAYRGPPPVLPPRSPLRGIHSPPLLVRTEFTAKESALIDARPFEPLTPPESTSSHSTGSSDHIRSPYSLSPFSEHIPEVSAPEGVKRRDTFYSRRGPVQVRAARSLS